MLPMPLRSDNGNALLLALAMAAVFGVITIEAFRRVEVNQNRGQASIIKDRANLAVDSLKTVLVNPEACTSALAGNPVTPRGYADLNTINFRYEDNRNPVWRRGAEISPGLRLTTAGITTDAADMHTILDDEDIYRYPARLQLTIDSTTGNSTSLIFMDTNNMSLPIYVWATATNRILTCFGRNSMGALCNLLGGYYRTDLPPAESHLRCEANMYLEDLSGGSVKYIGSCRMGGVIGPTDTCDRYDTPWSRILINDENAEIGTQEKYLCMLCGE